jgi:type I restriction enzyme S subunit
MAKKKAEKSLDELLEEALVKEGEQPYEVPDNWVWTRPTSLAEQLRGVTYKKKDAGGQPEEGKSLILRAGNLQEGEFITDHDCVYVANDLISNIQQLTVGDVVVASSSGSKSIVGKAAQVKKAMPNTSFGAFLTLFRLNNLRNSKYYGWFFQSKYYRDKISMLSAGININNIKREHFESLYFPLPPLPEQKRIVKKLSSMLGKLKEAKGLIQEARDTFEERRAAILNKAFTGALTKKWRDENPNVESAENLLERIQKRRKATYDAECKKAKKEGKTKPRRIFQDKFPEINYGIKIEIPKSWTYTNIGFLAHVTKLAGFEYTKYINFKDTGEIAIVRAQNVHMCEFIENNITYIDKKTSDFLVRSQLNEREVLMVFIGAGTGNVCMAPKGRRWHLGPNVAKIDVDEISAECINYYLQSHVGLANMRLFIKATAQPSLSMATIRKILVNLPPLQEQKEIVRILEKLLDHEDEARALIDMEEHIDLLEKSILSKAFSGELGTNDPNDEPAIELLKRSLKEKMNK